MRDDTAPTLRSAPTPDFDGFVGNGPIMQAFYTAITRAAASPASVLITGETGSGKELTAQSLHHRSPRRAGPLITLNCAALPRDLIESELFGHRRGAFTGATADHTGVFTRCQGGTLFLDEITEMPLLLQAKLLRVVETKHFTPVGDTRECIVDTRIIAASNRPLTAALQDGALRPDLYYRLSALTLQVPSLNARDPDDLLRLARYLIHKISSEEAADRPVPLLRQDAEAWLVATSWPGNVRALENTLRNAIIMRECTSINRDDLQGCITDHIAPTYSAPDNLAQAEHAHIARIIARCNGNLTTAAKQLGIDVSTLHRKRRQGHVRF